MKELTIATITAIVAFTAGHTLADRAGQITLRNAELEAAIARANQGRQAYGKLVEAQDALDASRRNTVRLSATLDRVRRAESQRTERVSADACAVERAAVSRCESLLRESVGLLAEGGNLLQRNADLHDALSKAVE